MCYGLQESGQSKVDSYILVGGTVTQSTIASEIKVDWPITTEMSGEITRGLDIATLFEEEDILGVSFNISLPPLINNSLKGSNLRNWQNETIYEALDTAANNTEGMDEFQLNWSIAIGASLCHLTSPCCHVSIFGAEKGVIVSGLLYNDMPTFDLYDFITKIVGSFQASVLTLEVLPLRRP